MSNDKEFWIEPPLTKEEYKFILFAFRVADEQGRGYRNIELPMSEFTKSLGSNVVWINKNSNNLKTLKAYALRLTHDIFPKLVYVKIDEDVYRTDKIVTDFIEDDDNTKLILSLYADKKYFIHQEHT